MSDASTADTLEPPPPPKKRNRWKIVAIVLGVIVALFVVLIIIGVFAGDSRDEKLAKLLPASIEANFHDGGIDVTVESVDCADLPRDNGDFTIDCSVQVADIEEVIEAKVKGSIDDDVIQVTDVSSAERLLTPDMAMKYVQSLVDSQVKGISVQACDLGASVIVIRPGSEIECTLDSDETVTVTVQDDGSGEITNVRATGSA